MGCGEGCEQFREGREETMGTTDDLELSITISTVWSRGNICSEFDLGWEVGQKIRGLRMLDSFHFG